MQKTTQEAVILNLNVGGITSKLMDKADWLTYLYAAYDRYDGDIGAIAEHYTSGDFLVELNRTLSSKGEYKGLLKHKLWESDHVYTTMFKTGVYAYLAAEIGIVPPKYKKAIEKVLLGSGAAALTMGGHPNTAYDRRPSTPRTHYARGINPFERR